MARFAQRRSVRVRPSATTPVDCRPRPWRRAYQQQGSEFERVPELHQENRV